MNVKKYSKKINFQKIKEKTIIIILKINKIAHSCSSLRISFSKRCVKDVVAAAFMFKLTLFQILGSRNDTLFYPLIALQRGISNAICDLVFT